MSIVLYGFNLIVTQIGEVGATSSIANSVMVVSTFGLTYVLGHKIFGLDKKTTILLGAGSSICSAAAIDEFPF